MRYDSSVAADPVMPGAHRLSGRARPPEPLNDSEQAAAEQVARRLHAELRGVISLMPLAERGASVLSRVLGVDRATCQRIVGVISRPDTSTDTLVQLPGVEGLRQFTTAVAAHHSSDATAQEKLAAAIAAVDRFEAFLTEVGRSQRRLKERLDSARRAWPGPGIASHPGVDDERTREALFRAAAGLTGRWSATALSVSIIRPLAGDPMKTETARLRGVIGHEWREPCIPLEIGQTAALRVADEGPSFLTLDGMPVTGETPGSLVPEFCSSPLPRITSRADGSRVVYVIDTESHPDRRPIDIVTGMRGAVPDRHPATLQPALGEVWSLQQVASRRLVFDAYLHREIARRCIPSLEVHLWTPDLNRHDAARWSTRLPGGPRLELLGPGLSTVATSAYPRFRDLIAHVYACLEWNPDDFVGYRCEVPFPAWRTGYCMIFDFTGNEMGK